MKTNEKSSLIRAIAALGLVLASPAAFAQTCTEGAGLTNITSTTSGHSAVGQSFTADCAGGEITAITIVWDTGGTTTGDDVQLNIYDGPDFNSPVLYTEVIARSSIVDGAATYTISPPVAITQGEMNSFEITAVGGGEAPSIANGVVYGQDVYPGGTPFWSRDTTSYTSLDLAFLVELNGEGTVEPIALFQVTKSFSNGADEPVEVTLTCNGGLPLQQSFSLGGDNPDMVTFTVTDIPGTGADCVISESGGPDGYTAVLTGGDGGDDCSWAGVTSGLNTCAIENVPEPTTVAVDTTVEGEDDPAIDTSFTTTIVCTNVSADTGSVFGTVTETDTTGTFEADWYAAPGETAECTATMVPNDMAVEGAECAFSFALGDEAAGCDLEGTVFFEGIPTLSQYGLALLALLMLGVGFVGMRRFG